MWHPEYSRENSDAMHSHIAVLDSTVNVRADIEYGIKKHANYSQRTVKKTTLPIVAVVTFAKHFPRSIRGDKSFRVIPADLGHGKKSLQIK